MNLRELTPADVPRCAELEKVLFPGETPWTEAVFEQEMAQPFNFYLGVEGAIEEPEPVKLLGYAGIGMMGPAADPEFEIHTIGVDPAAQRRGIARMMMDAIVELADSHDAPIFLEVRVGNDPAIRLYEAYDFVITGLRRTYPNWISREGARGMEYNAWGQPPNPPEHEVNLVFTRMLAGPMDYTPGILSLKGRHGQAIPSTLARQLALYVVLYSPIQMAADLPEHYLQHREAFRFIEDVAVDWEQSRVLDGEVGDYVTIVRRDRNSRDWFLGSITDEHGRVLPVSLGFLEPGVRYRAEIYRDGEGADFRSNPFAFARETREVTSADALTLVLAPGGGQAIRFTPSD
mgnify:CR=1 FL=1